MLGMTWQSENDWTYEPRLGFRLLGSDNLYIYGRFRDKENVLSDWGLYFWDWSQSGPDSCYGAGKWMLVEDESIVNSFPSKWKQELEGSK